MGTPRALGTAARSFHVGARERHLAVPHAQDLVVLRQLRECAHRLLDDLRPRGQSLDPSHGLVVLGSSVHARHQIAQGHGHDTRLAERGKHLLDIAQEQARRTHEEDPRALEALAVGVQEVGDAVQRNRGLAGARSALDHHEAFVGGANDPVLLGLDGGDDVAHATVARLAQRMHESALALKLQTRSVRRVQELVLQSGHSTVTRRNMAAANDAVRLGRCCLVEGACGGRAPVNE